MDAYKASPLEGVTVDLAVCVFRGVVLDRMTETGPRGGRKVYWRAVFCRDHQVATWRATRDEAARVAPGYTG